MATAAALRQRWYEPDGLRLTRAVRSWLMGQTSRPDGLSDIDGRVDLRGLPLSATPFTLGDKDDPHGGVTWESLDLRRAELDGLRFFGARLRDCLFDSAILRDLRLWGTEVADCSFRRAKMPGASLGSKEWLGQRVTWRRVAFDRADLTQASFWGAVLDACTFTNPRQLSIVDCDVSSCVFEGEVDRLIIDGRGHQYRVSPDALSADFTHATLKDSSIAGYRVCQVKFPDQADLLIVRGYPAVARRAVAWLTAQGSAPDVQQALGMLEYDLRAPGADDTDWCFDIHGIGDPDVELTLGRALQHAQNPD